MKILLVMRRVAWRSLPAFARVPYALHAVRQEYDQENQDDHYQNTFHDISPYCLRVAWFAEADIQAAIDKIATKLNVVGSVAHIAWYAEGTKEKWESAACEYLAAGHVSGNSSQVASESRNTPRTDEVTIVEFGFSTLRIIMHRWRALEYPSDLPSGHRSFLDAARPRARTFLVARLSPHPLRRPYRPSDLAPRKPIDPRFEPASSRTRASTPR